VGLETRPPPEGRLATGADDDASLDGRAASSPPKPPAPAASPPDLPPTAAKADDLEAIKKAVDDAASVGGGLWLSYLFVLLYLAVAAGAVTHADLFLENPVKVPFLNIELPLLAFFFLAPMLFIVVHAYTLVHLVFLTDKTKRFHQALHDPEREINRSPAPEAAMRREALQRQLPSNVFIQFLAGPSSLRTGPFGWLLRAIAWVTLVIAPVLLLLTMQVQFLPFHDGFITSTHRVVLLVDLTLVWWLWRKILSGRETDRPGLTARGAWTGLGVAFSLGALLFSWTVATFPGEWQESHLPSVKMLPTGPGNSERVSLHDWIFNSAIDGATHNRRFPFSNTLVLSRSNIYEGRKIDDPDKANWRDYLFRANDRDLQGAIFDLASLPNVDFTGANLEGATLNGARLQGAALDGANLKGVDFTGAQPQGASLEKAQLQGALLFRSQVQGVSFFRAQLQGALLARAQLQGAWLLEAQLQGATLDDAQLQGASLDRAQLQGASLYHAQLQGASLADAQLQGASLQLADLQATDLSNAALWRTNRDSRYADDVTELAAVRLPSAPEKWSPMWSEGSAVKPWDHEAYEDLLGILSSLPPGDALRYALENVRGLDCTNAESGLASCDSSRLPPNDAVAWRKNLEDARVDDTAYAKALAVQLRTLVCSGDKDAIVVLRGILHGANQGRGSTVRGRLEAAGPEAPVLVDFILSGDCPISSGLTGADKADLRYAKQNAMKKPEG
jgi:uncharacterized protein YjbI with pentapeptide repeats